MIFNIPKVVTVQNLLQDIRTISMLIQTLVDKVVNNPETHPYFQKVDLNQQQISDSLIQHSQVIKRLQNPLNKHPPQVNIRSIDHILNYLKRWFVQYNQNEMSYSNIQKVIKVIELEGKLNCFQEFIPPALSYQDDIAAFPLGFHPKYKHAYRHIQVIECQNAQKTRKNYKTFKDLITTTNASVLSQLKQSNPVLGIMAFGLGYPRFWLDHKQAQLRNFAFLRKPELEKLLSIWNLPQKGAISSLKYIQYPSIKTHKLIYIPLDEERYDSIDIFTPSERTVPVRLMVNRSIKFWNEQKGCSSCFHSGEQYDSLIIHAHGGGFVALSSSTMQNYTRLWSKQLDVPVFSIDYGKPPKHIFPDPVYHVFAVYKFISTQLYKHCNIIPNKIVLAGDSAGSNLVLSAYALALKEKLPKALGFFLAYPASDLRSVYTPSRISAFTDAILHPSLLLLCLRQYLGAHHKQVENHPLASPLLISQGFFTQDSRDNRWPLNWPKTRIVVGQLDPLLDDSVRLCAKMADSGTDVHLKIYRQLGHGCMSVQTVVKEGQKVIKDSIKLLREILETK